MPGNLKKKLRAKNLRFTTSLYSIKHTNKLQTKTAKTQCSRSFSVNARVRSINIEDAQSQFNSNTHTAESFSATSDKTPENAKDLSGDEEMKGRHTSDKEFRAGLYVRRRNECES